MASCKECGKSGIFLKLSKEGLCKGCVEKKILLQSKTTSMKNGKAPVQGKIHFFSLGNWWITTFSEEERNYIENKYNSNPFTSSLTTNKILSSTMSKQDFLSSLLTYFKAKNDSSIYERIKEKLNEVAEKEPVVKPGYLKGRHVSSFAEDIRELERNNEIEKAIELLYLCVEATENQSKTEGYGVAPWFYERLAVIYRKQKDLSKEYEILKRFSEQKHGNGVKPPKLLQRLEQVKQKINK